MKKEPQHDAYPDDEMSGDFHRLDGYERYIRRMAAIAAE